MEKNFFQNSVNEEILPTTIDKWRPSGGRKFP